MVSTIMVKEQKRASLGNEDLFYKNKVNIFQNIDRQRATEGIRVGVE